MHTMEIHLNGSKANAHFRDLVLETGTGSPSPFELFIASLGTCAALTAAGYCRKKGLSAEGLKINIDVERHPDTRLASEIKMEFVIPAGFPQEEIAPLVELAGDCFVKKHLYTAPQFTTAVTQQLR
ncbi:MAG: hypothetical protein FD169_652 [Bacillota bacterium]|nr:MAG: hypothetical protein FD169_652 [Bacillota bacterium]MBS3950819.1 OsmC family protein [Peptococcaceae bacterium]